MVFKVIKAPHIICICSNNFIDKVRGLTVGTKCIEVKNVSTIFTPIAFFLRIARLQTLLQPIFR